MTANVGGGTLGQDAPRIKNDDAVAIFGFLHEVSRDDDGHAVLGEVGDALPKLAAGERVGAAGRFVEKEDIGFVQQRRRHRQALLEAAGQFAARQPGERRQLEVLERPVNALPFVVAAQIVGAGEELKIFGDRELSVKREFLSDIADALAGRVARMAQVESGHAQGAAAGREEAAQHAKRRRLAGPVGPQQPEDLPALDFEADVIDRGEVAETPDQIVDLNDGLAGSRCRCGMGRDTGISDLGRFMRNGAMQQHHESIFKTGRYRLDLRVLEKIIQARMIL